MRRWETYPEHQRHLLDVSRRERLRQVVGTLVMAAIFIAVALLSGGPQ